MNEVGAFKAIEVLLLLAAGGLFVWWQLRDVRRAQQRTRAERELPPTQKTETVDTVGPRSEK